MPATEEPSLHVGDPDTGWAVPTQNPVRYAPLGSAALATTVPVPPHTGAAVIVYEQPMVWPLVTVTRPAVPSVVVPTAASADVYSPAGSEIAAKPPAVSDVNPCIEE